MKILSIDTASNICGVSILENENLICNLDILTEKSHSENLMPLIEKVFKDTSLELKDMDLITCDIGPGSFTGIRIGVATSKSFVDSTNIPCIGISSLESLAYNIKPNVQNNELICSIIDCKNNNCYFSLFENTIDGFNVLIEPMAENIVSALSILDSYLKDNFEFENTFINFVGNGSKIHKDKISNYFKNSNFYDDKFDVLNSYNLGLAGLAKYKNGIDFSDYEVLPLYLKKPQAERQLENKQ